MIRGFEPSRPTNESHWGAADILSQMVPAYVESVLQSQHLMLSGFSFKDATEMVIMLDQLIFNSENNLLEGVYQDQHKDIKKSLSHAGLKQVLESYMVRWMVEASPEDHAMLEANKTLTAEILPHYHSLMSFAAGHIKSFQYTRDLAYKNTKKFDGKDAMTMRYSFADAHKITSSITRSFQTYWQSECESMKSALVSMDSHHTGRVPLSKFYNTAINTDWRFGESEAYLRELGALDETSSWRAAQVIIPNYLQATSNCIVSTPHYLVCCVNECETIMGEIEKAIDGPVALPAAILKAVSNITNEDDEEPQITDASKQQLEQIASSHGGRVPLHGRLFAQWLHYVFPRECPFPHKTGAVTASTPSEYGEDHIATKEDMVQYAQKASDVDIPVDVSKEELQWMSQWSEDEELMLDYSNELSGSWARTFMMVFGLIFVVGGILGGSVGISAGSNKQGGGRLPGFNEKSHWV